MKEKLLKYIQESIDWDYTRIQLLETFGNVNPVQAEAAEIGKQNLLKRIEEGKALLEQVNNSS